MFMPGGRLGLGPPLTLIPGGRLGLGPPLTLMPGGRLGLGPPLTLMPGGSLGPSWELRPTDIPSLESLSMSLFLSGSSLLDTWIPRPASLSIPTCAELDILETVSPARPMEMPGGRLGAGGAADRCTEMPGGSLGGFPAIVEDTRLDLRRFLQPVGSPEVFLTNNQFRIDFPGIVSFSPTVPPACAASLPLRHFSFPSPLVTIQLPFIWLDFANYPEFSH
jgi:hypothetical protein